MLYKTLFNLSVNRWVGKFISMLLRVKPTFRRYNRKDFDGFTFCYIVRLIRAYLLISKKKAFKSFYCYFGKSC